MGYGGTGMKDEAKGKEKMLQFHLTNNVIRRTSLLVNIDSILPRY